MWTAQSRSALSAGVALAWMLLACSSRAFALEALDISQYVHTAWKARDGFTKGPIRSIAQTQDGYLWLGTDFGLLRFDGVRAVLWQPPPGQRLASNAIRSLLVTRDGTLWIGTDQSLASWKDGQLNQHEALAGSVVGRLVEDRDGSIWLTRYFNRWTLCRMQTAAIACFGEDGGAGAGALGLYEDRIGQLWVGTSAGFWRWTPGAPTFYPLAEEDAIQGFAGASDGSLLIAKADGIRRFVDGDVRMEHPFPSSMQSDRARDLLRDRDGGLWIGTAARGVMHVHDGAIDMFTPTDGLSGAGIEELFEDREGNVWVGTTGGLDRFRKAAAVVYSEKQGLSNSRVSSVLASRDGTVWVGTSNGLNRLANGHVTVYREGRAEIAASSVPPFVTKVREITDSGLPAGIHSIFEDSQGRLWVSTNRAVGYLANDKFVAMKGGPDGVKRAIVEDAHKTLWIANLQAGLFRLLPDKDAVEQFAWAILHHQDPVSAMLADPAGEGLWFGFYRGGISYFAGGQVRASYSSSNGLAERRVSGLYADPGGALWVAADGGLSRLKDGRVATLTSRNGLPCDAVGWVIHDDDRSLWLGMPCGLVRIARAEIDAWIAGAGTGTHAADAARPIGTTLFDHADGVRMYANASYYTAPVARAADGKLWFTSQDGIGVVDPHRLPFNGLPPPVHVEQVIADRKTYDAAASANGHVSLPALTRDLQIDYTALSLVAPEKMRFRYILEGHDRNWQDVGTRRQAFYNDLSPGSYRFRVIASNNDGVWNEAGAAVDFVIAPAYYQTIWFLALSVGMMLTLIWAVHRIRLRIVETHELEILALNERLMKAQEQERIRIAGELHDGVMQEMLAATMMLGTAKRRITGDSGAQATIDKVQQKLIQVGTDIRQLSHDLHPPVLQDAGLPEALRAYCEQFSAGSGIPVSCDADDAARELSRGAALALFRIVQEALGNAAKHAAATHISVRLRRSHGAVSLAVSDDGAGFDASRLGTSGGLGLIMMRERASQLNGTFEFQTAPRRGTTISVVIPFR